MLGRNCRSRLLTEASTNGVVALSAWYRRMGAISNICSEISTVTVILFSVNFVEMLLTFINIVQIDLSITQ